jgi:hypothetical protein
MLGYETVGKVPSLLNLLEKMLIHAHSGLWQGKCIKWSSPPMNLRVDPDTNSRKLVWIVTVDI